MTSSSFFEEGRTQPKHPQYVVAAVRLSSYSKWPATSSQNPMILCDAGFFYAGFSDCVRCFSCGGGLRHWEDGDNPWIEHARWYPDCDYLRQRKGDLFIQLYRQDGDKQPQTLQEQVHGQSQQDSTSSHAPFKEQKDENIAIRSVIEMGYPKSTVESCVAQLQQRGKANYTAKDIMEIIFENEEKIQEDQPREATTQSPDSKTIPSKANGKLQADDVSERVARDKRDISTLSTDFRSLIKENQELKEQMICKICMDKDACIVYLPCGHMVTCQQCAPSMRKCCICRQLIQGTVRAYL